MQLIGVGVEVINKGLGFVKSTLEGIQEKPFTKIKVTAGMTKPMVRDLAIEEAPHEDIKDTLEHNNQSNDEWFSQTAKGKNNNSFSWPYMIVSMI